jgi:hypothetical protein
MSRKIIKTKGTSPLFRSLLGPKATEASDIGVHLHQIPYPKGKESIQFLWTLIPGMNEKLFSLVEGIPAVTSTPEDRTGGPRAEKNLSPSKKEDPMVSPDLTIIG